MWFKVDDHLHASRKAAKAGAPAMGLWVLAGSWSAAEELDGFVPAYMAGRLAGAEGAGMAEALVEAGLWVPQQHDGEDGYRFHAWDEYQPTREQLEAKRADARERMRKARTHGGDVRANNARTSQSVTPTPTRPDPTLNNTTAAEAADTPAGFTDWWAAYPKRTGKAAAAKAYAKALRTTTPDALMAGLTRAVAGWAADRTEARFIPNPATWLNQGRWEDEQPALPAELTQPLTARRTPRQCPTGDPHPQHPWETHHGHPHTCLGVSA